MPCLHTDLYRRDSDETCTCCKKSLNAQKPIKTPTIDVTPGTWEKGHAIWLTCTAIAFLVKMNVYGVREITAELLRFLLGQSISCDDCTWQRQLKQISKYRGNVQRLTFKCLLDIDGLLGTGFKIWDVSLGLTEGHGSLRRYHPLILLNIDLVTKDHLAAQLVSARSGTREKQDSQKGSSLDPLDLLVSGTHRASCLECRNF